MGITWYIGGVATAVAEAKAKKASLIVFVQSDDEFTKMYEKVLNSLDTSNKWYIAIKLQAYSQEYEQLKAIYKIVPVPCVLVIDWENGMVMERIAGPLFDEELQEMFIDALINLPETQKEEISEKPKSQFQSEKTEKPAETKSFDKNEVTKIQFKTATESHVKNYKPSDKLGDLRRDVKTLFGLSRFSLAVPLPHRILGSDEDGLTLEELGLCPSSTIRVIIQGSNTVLPWNFLNTLGGFLQPIFDFFRGLWQRVFGGAPPPPPNQGSVIDNKKMN